MKKNQLKLSPGKKLYFASDFHLGIPNNEESRVREKKIVDWLDEVKKDAGAIYLVGDLFDFWFEYKHVVPKGFTRLLGKIAELTDSGMPVIIFTGNHDMWMFNYMEDELGAQLLKEPIIIECEGKSIYLGHGDGLGPGDHGYKFIKKVFANPICQWLFARLHPNFGIGMANFWSGKSRSVNHFADRKYHGEEKEMLVNFCKDYLKENDHVDYFIFGHRHLPLEVPIGEKSLYVNLGDWITYFTYGVFDGQTVALKKY